MLRHSACATVMRVAQHSSRTRLIWQHQQLLGHARRRNVLLRL
jgi:hypothetical protein